MNENSTTTLSQNTIRVIKELNLVPGLRVGDFGVGNGDFALAVANVVGPSGEVLMFDVKRSTLSNALGLAKMRGANNCRGVWTNLEIFEGASGVGRNSLDAGILINLLHQTSKPTEVLAEVHRMLKPSGRLIIIDWKPEAREPIQPEPGDRVARSYITELAQSTGFSVKKKFEPTAIHWGLVLIKT